MERLCCHKWFRVCTSILTCIAIDDLLGGGRREELSALMPNPNRLYYRRYMMSLPYVTYGSDSKSY